MKKYYKYELNLVIANILSLVMFFIPIIILSILKVSWYASIFFPKVLFFILLYFILHELLHGLGFYIFTKNIKNIKFGITLEKGLLYTLCQEKIKKNAILISLLLPLIFLSFIAFFIGLVFKLPLLITLSITNFSGSVGDILMSILILTAPRDVLYMDYNADTCAYLISSLDMHNHKSFGFSLIETNDVEKKSIDNSIKRLYVSKTSTIILFVITLIFIISSVI